LSLAEKAYHRLKELIVSNKFPPGFPLSEQTLAQELGMSRTPVREALRKLERDGLVETVSHRGAFVTGVSPKRLQEIFQVREILEPELAKIAAPLISVEKAAELEQKLLSLLETEEVNPLEAHQIGDKVHRLILETVNNELLIHFMGIIQADINRGCYFAMLKPENVMKFLRQHIEIVRALKERNPELARQKMLEHILETKKSVLG